MICKLITKVKYFKSLNKIRFMQIFYRPDHPTGTKKAPTRRKKLIGDFLFSTKVSTDVQFENLPPEVYLYSLQALISISSSFTLQKALMKAEASREFVIRGTFRSMAARRIIYPFDNSFGVRSLGIFTTISIFF